jgi:hypothetical protein
MVAYARAIASHVPLGVDLGLGFTTIRVGSLYWIVSLVVMVLASPWLGAAILGAYGLALVLNVGIGAMYFERGGHGDCVHANVLAIRLFRPRKVVLAVALLAWSISLMAVAL